MGAGVLFVSFYPNNQIKKVPKVTDNLIWAESCCVGIIKGNRDWKEVQCELYVGGYYNANVIPMEGIRVLLTEFSQGGLEILRNEDLKWLGSLFANIDSWC